tara:strand:- start:3708 stop:4568 length:861 start_codon:yes stop_codon:yes gene_type:complete
MVKKISFLIFKIILLLNFFFKHLKYYIYEYLKNSSFTYIKLNNQVIKFFTPSALSEWRINNFFIKEPETLEWIDSFKMEDNIIFWDIGANIGVYSIYAATKYEKIKVVAFEPSVSNLNILARNISLNNLKDTIIINQFPLSESSNQYLMMNESSYEEGSALHSFGVNYNFEGIKFNPVNQYKIFGNSINNLLQNNILDIPDYIKIDVDGIEHLILKGGSKYLNNSKIKSISIELNENFQEQFNSCINILNKSNFYIRHKKRGSTFGTKTNDKFSNTFNYVFDKKNI